MNPATQIEEDLIRRYILTEAAAENIITDTPEGYIFQGHENDYVVELKVFRVPTRLKEPAVELAYD